MNIPGAMARFRALAGQYFGEGIPPAAQAFNLLGLAGMAAGILAALSSIVIHTGAAQIVINLSASALALILLRYANKTGRYRLCCWIVVIAIFLLALPALFFTAGGFRSGMPSFFIFALIFTALMLDGVERAAALSVEFAVYAACCVAAYVRPETVTPFGTELGCVIDVLTGIIVAGGLLLSVIPLHMRIYRRGREGPGNSLEDKKTRGRFRQ
jgi:hypothetical protein